jgi:hypothetical protein
MEWVVEAEEVDSEADSNRITQIVASEVDISNKLQEAVVSLIIREEATHKRLEETLTRWEIPHRVDTNLKTSHHLLEEVLQISKLSCADTSNFVSKFYHRRPFSRMQAFEIQKMIFMSFQNHLIAVLNDSGFI